MKLPMYATEEAVWITVFDVIKDTIEKCPEVIKELKEFINDAERSYKDI